MPRVLVLVFLALVLAAGEADRAGQEARALQAVLALDDGPRREAGLRILRGAWQRFRDDAIAAERPASADDGERITDLRARNGALAALRTVATEQGAAAIDLLEAHLERWPLDDEARLLLGGLRLAAGDRDHAWEELLAALALHPTAPAARELRGRLSLGSSDPAIVASAAADLAPLVGQLLTDGCAAEAAGDTAAAARCLAQLDAIAAAVTTPGDHGRLAALRGAAAARAGDAAGALTLWRAAATAGVTAPDPAPQLRALIRRLRADDLAPALAANDLAVLTELSPAFPERDDLQERLFRLLLSGGKLIEARDAARALLAAEPAHPLATLLADGAQAALDPRRLELLPAVIARVRAEAPALGARFAVVHALHAALSESAGDAAGAAAALDPLLAARPDDRDMRWQRARLRLLAGDRTGAADDCTALLAGAPDDAEALALRGRIRAAAGDQAGALADADRVVALRPGPVSLAARARIHHALKDAAGLAADLVALAAAATTLADSALLMDALDLTADQDQQRLLLERARQLGNGEAARRLRRTR